MAIGFIQIQCPACGAPTAVSDSTEVANCSYCRSKFVIERRGNSVTASILKELATVVTQSQEKTQAHLTAALDAQRQEQQTLWREQQKIDRINSLEAQLLTVQSEIRMLTRAKLTGQDKRDLAHLRDQEAGLRQSLAELTETLPSKAPGQPANGLGCFAAFAVYVLFISLLQAMGLEDPLAIVALIIGVVVFFYVRNAAAS